MKKSFLLALLLVFSAGIQAAQKFAEPKVVKINPRVYALLGPVGLPDKNNQGYMVNSAVILGEKGIILVDTGSTDLVGAHIKSAVAKISPKPVTHIINTHHHGDHHLGNVAFPGAEIISSEQCKQLVEKTGQEWVVMMENMIGGKFPNTKPMPATVTFKEDSLNEKTYDGVKITLWVPKGSHTPGDTLVYLPDDKVLIGGDVIVHHTPPNLRDGHARNWIETLKKAQQFDANTIIPGHGPLMKKADVARLHDMLAKFYAQVEAGYKKGLSDSEIRKTLDLSEWKKLGRFEEVMGGNISRAYLEAEAANF